MAYFSAVAETSLDPCQSMSQAQHGVNDASCVSRHQHQKAPKHCSSWSACEWSVSTACEAHFLLSQGIHREGLHAVIRYRVTSASFPLEKAGFLRGELKHSHHSLLLIWEFLAGAWDEAKHDCVCLNSSLVRGIGREAASKDSQRRLRHLCVAWI